MLKDLFRAMYHLTALLAAYAASCSEFLL